MAVIIFVIFVFPLFFLGLPVVRLKPLLASIFLILGFVLWVINGLKILSFTKYPEKLAEKNQEVQSTGKPVRAQILDITEKLARKGKIYRYFLIEFVNLSENLVRTRIEMNDIDPYKEKFQKGSHLNLKLNRHEYEPALVLSDQRYDPRPMPIIWFFFVLNFVYMIVFFLVAYHYQSGGFGWRFINPLHPWFWTPILSLLLLRSMSKSIFKDTGASEFDIQSSKSMENPGKLILYGKSATGKIMSYRQTGGYEEEMPQILLNISWKDGGRTINKTFKKSIDLLDLDKLRNKEVYVLYDPKDLDSFAINLF